MSKILIILFLSLIVLYGCKDNSTNPVVNQQNMKLVSTYSTNASTNGVCVLPINFRNYALIADGSNGMQIIDVNQVNSPDSIASFDINGSANDVTAANINGSLYAFISDYSGSLVVVDISTPSNPVWVGSINNTGNFVNKTFIDAVNRIAYIGMEGGTILIYDISPLPNQPNLIRSYYIGGGGSASIKGLCVSGSLLYIASGQIGLSIVDVSDPANPQPVSLFNTAGIANDVKVSSGYAYVADSYNGMLILNVNDPAAPVYSSKYTGSGQILGVSVNNNNVFTADNTYGIENVNVSSPNSPTQQGFIQTNSSALNIFYFGGYVFLAAAEGGMAIFQPTN